MLALLIFSGTRGQLDFDILLLWFGFIGIVTVIRESLNIFVIEEAKPNE
jgi:hypothetical protein